MKTPWLLIVAGAALSQMGSTGGGCSPAVLRDPGFDLWCGDQLCAWKVERGDAQKVPTWHEGDSGVELSSYDVAIEQLSPVNSSDGTCIKFDLVANVDDNAEVYFNVDVQSDGSLEMHERIPTSHWKPLTYSISIPGPYDGIRFEITKAGTGKAVLANIQANLDTSGNCQGLTPLDPGPRKNGSTCYKAADCASGLCIPENAPLRPPGAVFSLVCAGCDPSVATTCGTGQVCGVGDAATPIASQPIQCEPAASRELGEQCLLDGDCASGICWRNTAAAEGVCSACRIDTDCAPGVTCAPAWPGEVLELFGPFVCGGNQHVAPKGAPCGNDSDCASGTCSGAPRSECPDGRPCLTAAECPFGTTETMTGLQNGACNKVGVQGGTCD